MTLQHRICLSLCALAIAAHAAPLIENNHLKIKDGAVELDRKGDVVFSENFSNGFTNWEASNFENKLVMDVRKVLGEQAAYIGMEKPNSDTAWELAGKPFDVIGGSDFTIKIRAMGTFPLHNPSGHKDMYKMCLYWFDAKGKRLENIFPYRFTMNSKDWTDTYCDGVVPKEAVKAQFFVGFDVPNVPEGEHMAISEVEIIQKTDKHSYYNEGSFVSLPYFTNKGYVDMACNAVRQEGSSLRFLRSMAPDNNGTPGEWTKFVNFDADDTGRHPGRSHLPNGHSWCRYKAIMRSNGTTPRLKSVTIDDRIDKNWTYSIDKSPCINMLSKSPNQDPASEIRFKLLEDTIISWPTVRYLLDDVDITAKTTRNGSIISYKPAEPLKPVPPSLSPRTWAFHNYQNVLKMYNLQDSRSAVRVTRLAEEQDSSFRFVSQPIAVKGGEIYTLRYKIRHNNNLEKADDRSHITWLTNSNQPIGDPIIIRYGKPLTEWTEKAITLAAPENAALVVIQFGFDVPNIKKNEYFDLDVVAFDGPRPADAIAKSNVHRLQVEGKDYSGKRFQDSRLILYDKEATENIVTMRDDGFVLVDGKPFFPIGLYAVWKREFNGNNIDKAFKDLKAAGFNFAHTYNASRNADFAEFLNTADKYGFKLWITPGSDMINNIIRECHHPSILAWYIGDDTHTYFSPEDVKRNHDICHSLDNAHLTTQADGTGPRGASHYEAFIGSTDSFMPEIYPVREDKPDPKEVPTVIRDMKTIYDDLSRNGSPVKTIWAIIQHFDGWGWKRFPTFDELRAMSYLSIIHGAHGITWYTYGGYNQNHGVTSTPEHWKEITTVAGELASIQNQLCSRHAKEQPAVTILSGPQKDALEHPSVTCLLKDNDGPKILLACNSSTEAVQAAIDIKGFKTAKVLFEDRIVDCANGLKDDFKPFAVHVYELNE
jgi:hypothetical protein